MKIRLHIPGLAHTITNNDFSHCAFTGKILRFGEMMLNRGFEVYYYGVSVATSEIKTTKSFETLSINEWNILKKESYKFLTPTLSDSEIETKMTDPKTFYGELCNITTPLYTEFNKNFAKLLKQNYRSKTTDIVCLPFGRAHLEAIKDLDVVKVESGIGYTTSYESYRIFESYAILHQAAALENKYCQHYWFVVPNYYNINDWTNSKLNSNTIENTQKQKKRIGFFGRICQVKGMDIVLAVAKKFPDVEFVICGQGDPKPYQIENITYKQPICGLERRDFLSSLDALLAPSIFCEPFCGVSVEAQLCGTPVISNEFGALTETVEQFKTGVLCHTLADFCFAVKKALKGEFNRKYIAKRARKLYDMNVVGKKYEYVFKSILEIHNNGGGWYSDKEFISLL